MDFNRIIECKTSTMISLQISVSALIAKNNTGNLSNTCKTKFLIKCIKLLPDVIHAHNMDHLLAYHKYFIRIDNYLIFRTPEGTVLKRVQIYD